MNRIKKHWKALTVLFAAIGIIVGGVGIATAATSAPPNASIGCVSSPNRTLTQVYENVPNNFTCTNGFAVTLSGAGTQGPAGATGAQGPSGVQAIDTSKLTATASVPTGGSFNSKAVQVGSIDLKAGTYLINLSAQSEPNGDTSSSGVQPQFFLYDQTKNASFAGDLLNIGSGTLAPAGTNHDSYASGSTIVTLSSDTTLLVYGFGYDNDSGASDYSLITGSIDAVQLTPAS